MERSLHIKRLVEKGISHVIFDFDETLCTLQIDWTGWSQDIASLLRRHDASFRGFPSPEQINALVRRNGKALREELIEVNARAERRHYHGYLRNEPALDFLKLCSVRFRVHLWTSNDIRTVGPILDDLGVRNVFTTIVCSNDVLYLKPDPSGFHKINPNGIPVDRFVFFGDSTADRGACDAAGIEYVDIRTVE